MSVRFEDLNLRLTAFQDDVLIVCPNCSKKANTTVNYEDKKARLFCLHCGCNKEKATDNFQIAAHGYFDAKLWLSVPFKDDVFWAFNLAHLTYLESYISANLRAHKDRSHFTLLEKLPKFYHVAKNRESLLKLIERLKRKD